MTTPFDELAPLYAELWSESAEGRRQRDEFWREIEGLFPAGSRILDLGCGPGDDALHLMEQGVDVLGIDNSEAMVAVARERGVVAEWTAIEDLGAIQGEFDGAISNFGALNCVEDLGEAARKLHGLIRAGGVLAICVMGRFSWKETLRYLIRLDPSRAVRRWTGRTEWRGMQVFYRSSGATRRAFEPYFELQRRVPIGGGDHDFYLFRRA